MGQQEQEGASADDRHGFRNRSWEWKARSSTVSKQGSGPSLETKESEKTGMREVTAFTE